MERLVLTLRYTSSPIAFEVIGTNRLVRIQFACHEAAVDNVRNQLKAHFPEVVLGGTPGWLAEAWSTTDGVFAAVVDFGLSHEFMLPLSVARGLDVDPLIGITGAMADLGEGEFVACQTLFQETTAPWTEHALRAVGDGEGGAFFADAPHIAALAKEKLQRPLFAVVTRIAVQAPTEPRVAALTRAVSGSLAPLDHATGNALIPLSNDDYPHDEHQEDFLQRRSRRSGMLLNVDELVTLVHPPSPSVRTERLERAAKKTRGAPAVAVGHPLILGTNTHNGRTVTVSLNPTQRLKHMYVIGASGTGKSTLLLNMVLQDLKQGAGFAVLDPHGDLIDQILGQIPSDREEDVVLFDAADEDYPVGLNILTARSEIEKNLLASDLVAGFRRLSTTWGDQMTSVLGNAILAFLERRDGGTLADLRRFLVEPNFRDRILETVEDPEVVYYWKREFTLLAGRPQAPLLTRLDTFLRPKIIRHMVSQRKDRLDFRWMMDNRKVFLAKLAQGAIGEENAYLLGTLIVTKLHQMALGRQDTRESERTPFYLYIDEFHNFITPSIAAILSGARKFGLGLVLSHQELRQVAHHSADVGSAVIANPYTRVCFRLGDDDAKRLTAGFSSFDARDLQSLGVGEAIVRMERAEFDFTMATVPLPEVDADAADATRTRVTTMSRERYARPREEVAREIAESRGTEPDTPRRDQPPQHDRGGNRRPPKRFRPPRQEGDQSKSE
jgi:DNA helicase HerA-like ATPase